MPGITMLSAASISNVPSGTSRPGPTASMRLPTTRTSASSSSSWASFIVSTVPPRKTIGRPGSGSGAFVVIGLLVVVSGDEDQLRAAGRLALALPRLGDLVEPTGVDIDRDVAGGGVLGQARVRVALEVERRMGHGEAADVERCRADPRRGQRELAAGHVADLDVAGKARGDAHGGQRGRPPQHVDGDVDVAPGGLLDALGEAIAPVDLHDSVCAAGEQRAQAVARAVGRDDAARPEELRGLHRDAAD